MPRERHDYLTNETKDTLEENVKAAARGLDKSPSYVYRYLREEAPDPFAEFDPFYEGLCRGGVSTEHYDARLAYHRERYRRTSEIDPAVAVCDKISADADTNAEIVRSLADGVITAEEAMRILAKIKRERELLDEIEKMVHQRRVEK